MKKQKLDGPEARIADYFDVIGGTSTGGIVTAMLITPSNDQNGRPIPAKQSKKFNLEEGPKIFSDEGRSARQQTNGWPEPNGFVGKVFTQTTMAGVWAFAVFKAPEYDGVHLRRKIKEFCKGRLLSDTLANVVIPAYNMQDLHLIIFSTQQDYAMNAEEAKMNDVSPENLERLEKVGKNLLTRSVSTTNPDTGWPEIAPVDMLFSANQYYQTLTNKSGLISFAKKLS